MNKLALITIILLLTIISKPTFAQEVLLADPVVLGGVGTVGTVAAYSRYSDAIGTLHDLKNHRLYKKITKGMTKKEVKYLAKHAKHLKWVARASGVGTAVMAGVALGEASSEYVVKFDDKFLEGRLIGFTSTRIIEPIFEGANAIDRKLSPKNEIQAAQ